MVDEIRKQLEIHKEECNRAAYRFAKFEKQEDKIEFEKQDYVINILISLLPK